MSLASRVAVSFLRRPPLHGVCLFVCWLVGWFFGCKGVGG